MSESFDRDGIIIIQKSRRTLHGVESCLYQNNFFQQVLKPLGSYTRVFTVWPTLIREGKHDVLAHFKQIIEDPTLVFSNIQSQIKVLYFANNYLFH